MVTSTHTLVFEVSGMMRKDRKRVDFVFVNGKAAGHGYEETIKGSATMPNR